MTNELFFEGNSKMFSPYVQSKHSVKISNIYYHLKQSLIHPSVLQEH